jgi:hypothetical protein
MDDLAQTRISTVPRDFSSERPVHFEFFDIARADPLVQVVFIAEHDIPAAPIGPKRNSDDLEVGMGREVPYRDRIEYFHSKAGFLLDLAEQCSFRILAPSNPTSWNIPQALVHRLNLRSPQYQNLARPRDNCLHGHSSFFFGHCRPFSNCPFLNGVGG